MIVVDPVEVHVLVQGSVGVTLAIQEHTALMVSLCSQTPTNYNALISDKTSCTYRISKSVTFFIAI